jgi:hypothetical protein
MGLTGVPSLEVMATLVAGLLATIGAVVGFVLIVSAVQGGVAMVGRFVASRFRTRETEGRVARAAEPPPVDWRFVEMPDPALFARQAWWRLRC